MQSPSDLLGLEGPLARHIPGFSPRPQQQAMAEAVWRAIEGRRVLVAEAGTGTGKTFAYIVPALLSEAKVVVSTGTKNLQDQLFQKDLPLIRSALARPVEVALLKGRGNYLCPHRIELTRSDGRFITREQARTVTEIARFAERSATGDIAEFGGLAEESPLWGAVTSSADNCLGGECAHLERCFLLKARRKAMEAELVVVNHHLLFADMALREGGFGELLPTAQAFILDEAHQIPEIASAFFGTSVSGNQLRELAGDTVAEDLREAGEDRDLRRAAEALEKAARDARLAFGDPQRRGAWREIRERPSVVEALDETLERLGELKRRLEPLAQRGKGLESCLRRTEEIHDRLTTLLAECPEGFIHWYEVHPRSFTLHLTPMEIAPIFKEKMQQVRAAWVFSSATLSVDGRFDHFRAQMGLDDDVECLSWESPFDYRRQALFYVPEGMADPRSPGYTAAVVAQARPVLEASRGRAFLLFTSHRALQEAAALLRETLPYPLLIQGEMPRNRLLERFRELGNAVLLGTGSFWEGVDVRGEALSCVVIDKLPFGSPGDPVLQARIDAMREQGRDPFAEHQLPEAVISLKQGVGRLIRDVNDHGVMMVCDPRLLTKPYGRVFIESLPRMSRTRSLEIVKRYFAHLERVREEGTPPQVE